jgi:hypothetical protein
VLDETAALTPEPFGPDLNTFIACPFHAARTIINPYPFTR